MILDGETILPDDYPVFYMYWYLLDGEPQRSDIEGNVATLKQDTGAKEIRRCELIKRINMQKKEISL